MTKQQIIEMKQLCVENRLSNINESVYSGEQIHLLGANGAGKSTLLSVISGFQHSTGKLLIHHKSINQYSVKELSQIRAYFPQQISVQPILKVFQYLALFQSQNKHQASLFAKLCQDFQLESLLLKPIMQLSGGEWQRVRIIAIFLQVWNDSNLCGKFILLDEPMNNLDIVQQAKVDKWVKYFCHQGGAVIISGHNLSHSYQFASRIWMMKKGEIIFSGSPENVMTDSNLSVLFAGNICSHKVGENKSWQVINFDD